MSPKSFTLAPNAKQKLKITIDGTDLADNATAFAQITLKPRGSATAAVLPVAAHRTPGKISLSQSCVG